MFTEHLGSSGETLMGRLWAADIATALPASGQWTRAEESPGRSDQDGASWRRRGESRRSPAPFYD